MSVTAKSSPESARRKFFFNSNVYHVKKVGIKRFFSQEAEMSPKNIQVSRIGEKKIFHQLDVHYV